MYIIELPLMGGEGVGVGGVGRPAPYTCGRGSGNLQYMDLCQRLYSAPPIRLQLSRVTIATSCITRMRGLRINIALTLKR